MSDSITAKVIQDSISAGDGVRLTTFQLHYPRIIHSEFMTHRNFSRNAASSRAIKILDMIAYIEKWPAKPVHWGKNKAGMQAEVEIENKGLAEMLWLSACSAALSIAKIMESIGLHKQVVNRITEPYQFMDVVMSATEVMNFFYLRYHKDADPTIYALAKAMWDAYIDSEPEIIYPGEWHVPYVKRERDDKGTLRYYDELNNEIDVETAQKISSSCCAQVSFRKNDPSLEKAENVFNRLVMSDPIHASALEHAATPVSIDESSHRKKACELTDDESPLFIGNFRLWRQYRKFFKNENFNKQFVPELNIN